ncbi:MAG: tetratricopeptide repeat protein [Gammaproteobacteria bacterium]|nr:tetratricopeptide repeat protein [Gammaproteobacteria bacterium]NIM74815.1 tetratricopeptide repeat protein [Gammaproteobacteria bacterium]NIN39246.1 tetratricopeptide repeat protein [Gammaproteobacteria bacterium]NIO26732.1 tetratricopeptide repeat protein [Gammaproteobacteria bacterium]NIO67288.1 tetratricopeptide repeat protein [Gammaproteobacteria bacterium]
MSLLMDALKRAEKARQAEASSDGAELDMASTQGFSLDPIDESASGERPLPREPTLDRPVSPSDTSDRLSLEDTREMQGRLGIEADDTSSFEDIGEGSLDDSISIIDDANAIDVEHSIPADTSATLPSVKQAQRSVDSYFDDDGSVSVTRDDLRSAMAEATTAGERVGGDTETQRRVRAVFHAKEASRSRAGRNWLLVGVLPLLLVVVIGGLALLYWDSLERLISGRPDFVQAPRPAPTSLPQPAAPQAPAQATQATQATQQATTQAGAATGVPQPAPGTASAAPQAGAERVAAATPAAAGAAAVTPAPDAGETATERQTSMAQLARSAPSAAQVTAPPAGSRQGGAVDEGGPRLSAEELVAQRIQSAGMAPPSPTGGAAFKIKRRSTPDRLHPLLAQAYEAWRAGDLVAAKRSYQRVLKSDPRNRNAHLGLGAIAVRDGMWDEASEHYTTLLRLNPRDSVAQAGLIAIHENVDPLRGESQIKLLLREEPDAPHLHFTLGNMYAEQGRWGEAQSAYFDAYRLNSENPDYTYNLAVSLDQLGKGKAAADYYRRALELAGEKRAAFDQPSVRDRLLRLAFEGSAQ